MVEEGEVVEEDDEEKGKSWVGTLGSENEKMDWMKDTGLKF